MPGIPDLIIKAPVFSRMGALSRNSQFWALEPARDKLKGVALDLSDPKKKILDIAKAAWLYDNNASTAHFERHWLNSQNDGYWNTMQDQVEAVLRAGMKRACEIFIASGYSKPFDYLWVISGDTKSTRWEMSICDSPDHCTVIFHTPQTPIANVPTIDDPSVTVARWDAAVKKAVLVPVQIPVP
jgi:hypothetical protein